MNHCYDLRMKNVCHIRVIYEQYIMQVSLFNREGRARTIVHAGLAKG